MTTLVGAEVVSAELERIAEATQAAGAESVEALHALAGAVAVLRDGGLVSGAAAEECGLLLRRRLDSAADRSRLVAEGMRSALGAIVRADEEVADRVHGR